MLRQALLFFTTRISYCKLSTFLASIHVEYSTCPHSWSIVKLCKSLLLSALYDNYELVRYREKYEKYAAGRLISIPVILERRLSIAGLIHPRTANYRRLMIGRSNKLRQLSSILSPVATSHLKIVVNKPPYWVDTYCIYIPVRANACK